MDESRGQLDKMLRYQHDENKGFSRQLVFLRSKLGKYEGSSVHAAEDLDNEFTQCRGKRKKFCEMSV